MSCERCGHTYTYEGKEYEIESCPLCTHSGLFREFVAGEE